MACDTGGTFTDLVVERDDGRIDVFKTRTNSRAPWLGVLQAIRDAASFYGEPVERFLGATAIFIHGTTHALNAVVTGRLPRTALLTTAGHRDILVLREGGRANPFDFTSAYPRPLIPRSLTFEIPERITASGKVLHALDESAASETIARLRELDVEAIAVCLLWSIVNPVHELRVGELIGKLWPNVPFTLSHQVNPSLREYRRACSTALDAALKPVMSNYLGELARHLRSHGFEGELMLVTSQGGMVSATEAAAAPVHVIGSGPAMAPVAGQWYATAESRLSTTIVTDAGGTTFDVSLVRDGRIPTTRETWLGTPLNGHLTGLPAVDIKSVGAGGGSIARVDEAGVLHVGPGSAGSFPGPASYAQGGTQPTVTDAAVVLGYIDPDYFLGGAVKLDADAARAALLKYVAAPLGISAEAAAAAVLAVAAERMARAIEDITVRQGIDPRKAVLLAGGGAGGLLAAAVAERLECPQVIVPQAAAVLSAAGGLIAPIAKQERTLFFTTTQRLDVAGVRQVLDSIWSRCERFLDPLVRDGRGSSIELRVEARYKNQAWEIEMPIELDWLDAQDSAAMFEEAFHQTHERTFGFRDAAGLVELVTWIGIARRHRPGATLSGLQPPSGQLRREVRRRAVYFHSRGYVDAVILPSTALPPNEVLQGPAIIESPNTVIVVEPGSTFRSTETGSIVLGRSTAADAPTA